jgi:hypothetical protein
VNHETVKLDGADRDSVGWKKLGPNISESQWDILREVYSKEGRARDYFTHVKPVGPE